MLYRIRITRPDSHVEGAVAEYVRNFETADEAKGFGYGCGTALADELSDMACFPYEVAELTPTVIAKTM